MCVIVAKKSKLKSSNKDNWFLYKVRDRAYDPKYTVKYNSKGDVQAVFLVDQDSDWTEGVNSAGIMLVSAALQNHDDKKDGTKDDKSLPKQVTRNGVILRQVLRMDNIKDVVDTLVEERFTGNTFVSDGEKLFIIEIYIKKENVDKYTEQMMKGIDTSELDVGEIKRKVMAGLQPDDYGVSVKEIKKDRLVARTNHGIIDDNGGYQPNEDGYESSKSRLEVALKALKVLDDDSHPFYALTILKNLTREEDKEENNPIRVKGNDSGYFSGTVVMLTPTGSLFAVPLHASFENVNFERIFKERKVQFVLLPKNLPLFENSFASKALDSLIVG